MTTLLLLAGTSEARGVARHIAGRGDFRLIASLAGVTRQPASLPCETRTGGFGGADGMAAWLREEDVAAVIDATHPFAAAISANAVQAAAATGLPLLRYERLAWQRPPGARWHDVADMAAAVEVLPPGARAFLTVGAQSLAPFAARRDVWWLTRTLEPLPHPFAQGRSVTGRPPFTHADEAALMRDAGITHLVTKNSGGAARAKLDAAAELGIETVMIRRPLLPPAPLAEDLAGLDRWLDGLRLREAGS